jgi:hypothetical protein
MLKVAAILFLPFALVAGILASSSYVVVDIEEKGPDGIHLVVPVPLALAQAALSFVPDRETRIPCPELAEYLPVAKGVIEELTALPDSELVRVEEGEELVLISKVGENLEVEVHDHGEDVVVSLPLPVVVEILESYDGESFAAADVVSALTGISRSDLVQVRSDNETVKVWIW